MKYIFVAGVPGSKWSSVVKNIYYSTDIDRSDYSDARTYYHDAQGEMQLTHLGAYFDPGMEFGDFFDTINQATKSQCEREFNKPFDYPIKQNQRRIIKSHVFCNHIDYLKAMWPNSPIVLVHRDDDASLGWWVKCGHFDITYPLYHEYYRDLKHMAKIIEQQNKNLLTAWDKYKGVEVKNNLELSDALDIRRTGNEYFQDYVKSDIRVKVI
jgi:hypothetical protein